MYLEFNFYNQSHALLSKNQYYLIISQLVNKHLKFNRIVTITEKSNYTIDLNIKVE